MIRKRAPNGRVAALAAALLLVAQASGATVIASHVGSDDPTGAAWTAVIGAGGDVGVGPIDDGGTPAWAVDDLGNASGTTLLYRDVVSDAEIAMGNATGWILRVVLRVSSSDVTEDGSLFAGYRDGVSSWQMNWGHDDQGNTVVKLFSDVSGALLGPTHTVAGSDTYNTYELVYDPLTGTVDLLVNGIERISDHAGLPGIQVGNTKEAVWGAGRSAVAGQGRYNEVTLEIVPEPSTFSLVGLALLGIAIGRRRAA